MATLKAGAKIHVSEQKTSRFVESQLPSFLIDMESMIVPFLKAYYEWMERENGVTYDVRRLLDIQDIDKTTDEFIQFFMEEFLPGFPQNILSDKRLLLKHAREFYSSKGSENSFKFLFKILYNEDVEISYPKEDIFRSSDAVWVVDNVLKVSAIDPMLSEVQGRRIYGTESNASAVVDRITFSISGSSEYASLYVSDISGEFLVDEAIVTRDNLQNLVMRCLGQIGGVSIVSPGTGYTTGDIIPLSDSGDGNDFSAIISTVGINGDIKKVSLVDSGVFYFSNPPVADLTSLSGSGAEISFNIKSLVRSEGRFADDSCMPSSTKRLQDGKLYQEYSYVLKSGVSVKIFKDSVLRLLHPAGFFMGSLMVALGNAGIPINAGVFNLNDINFDDPDHPSNRMFIDVVVRREYAPDEVWAVEKIDQFYPNGIPLGKTLERIFSPELLNPLHQQSVYEVRATSKIEMVDSMGEYAFSGYVDPDYWVVNYYPGIAYSNVTVIGTVNSLLLEDGFSFMLEDGSGTIALE